MSCLTRDMQKQLGKYIKRNVKTPAKSAPSEVHATLVSKGVCPSDVTVDQLAVIMEDMRSA